MVFSKARCDLLGAIVALSAFALADAVFVARLLRSPVAERIGGALFLTLLIPVAYLCVSTFYLSPPRTYVVWIGLFALFLLAELLLDYVFAVPFRQVRWQVVLYVVSFFGAFGGLIGLAGLQGRGWGAAAIGGFLPTALLAFAQHRATGL